MAKVKSKGAKIDPGITWITLGEAAQKWGRKSKRGLIFARGKGNIMMRKSGSTWLVRVADVIAIWGEPIEPITWGTESMF